MKTRPVGASTGTRRTEQGRLPCRPWPETVISRLRVWGAVLRGMVCPRRLLSQYRAVLLLKSFHDLSRDGGGTDVGSSTTHRGRRSARLGALPVLGAGEQPHGQAQAFQEGHVVCGTETRCIGVPEGMEPGPQARDLGGLGPEER